MQCIMIHSALSSGALRFGWLRTNGINTNGAAAKVKMFDRLGEKVRPGTFGKIKVGSREYPESPSKNIRFAATPLVLTPFCPSPTGPRLSTAW